MKQFILLCITVVTTFITQAQVSGYRISGARVSIKTGNDNKENPSKVQVFLFSPHANTHTQIYALGQLNFTNEMKIGSTTNIGLVPLYKQTVPWPIYFPPNSIGAPKKNKIFTSGSTNWLLEDLQRQGFRLLIAYSPNLVFDAWKIEQVVLTLEIKKADGTAHPTLDGKKIVFTISSPALGAATGVSLICEADKNLSPTTHYLSPDIQINKH